MTSSQLRKQIKKSVDAIPPERLTSLAEYVAFLSRPPLKDRIERAEKAIAARKGVNWRTVSPSTFS